MNAECCRRKNLRDSGPPFIDSVSRLIALLLDYRSVSTDESYRARRMGCMFNLLVSILRDYGEITDDIEVVY